MAATLLVFVPVAISAGVVMMLLGVPTSLRAIVVGSNASRNKTSKPDKARLALPLVEYVN